MKSDERTAKIRLGYPASPYYPADAGIRSSSLRKMLSLQAIASMRSGQIQTTEGSAPIEYLGNGHLMTIAPTRTGKGRSVIIPNLLTFPDPIIIVDPRGENYAVTAKAREEMGHKIVRLDPFGVDSSQTSDSFNPFDILDHVPSHALDESIALTELLAQDNSSKADPFWEISATNLLSAVGMALYTGDGITSRSFGQMQAILNSADPSSALAKIQDAQPPDSDSSTGLVQFLAMGEVTRQSVVATAQQRLRVFISSNVRQATETTSFDLGAIKRGEKVSVYIIVPPAQLSQYGTLLRLWVGALLRLIAGRSYVPRANTLFLLDEAPQLGHLQILETALALMGGYGLQIWTFWQDLNQLKSLYPSSWFTMIGNSAVLQLFGANMVNSELAEFIGISAEEFRHIDRSEQVLVIDGEEPVRAARLDYLNDPDLKGRFSSNPLYG